jgi:hypothetical protein
MQCAVSYTYWLCDVNIKIGTDCGLLVWNAMYCKIMWHHILKTTVHILTAMKPANLLYEYRYFVCTWQGTSLWSVMFICLYLHIPSSVYCTEYRIHYHFNIILQRHHHSNVKCGWNDSLTVLTTDKVFVSSEPENCLFWLVCIVCMIMLMVDSQCQTQSKRLWQCLLLCFHWKFWNIFSVIYL